MKQFCAEYLAMQGVLIMPPTRVASKQVETMEKETVPIVAMYERD